MANLSTKQAHEIIRDMRDAAFNDSEKLAERIQELEADYEKDPWVDTAVQITRLKNRLQGKLVQAEALAIAATKF